MSTPEAAPLVFLKVFCTTENMDLHRNMHPLEHTTDIDTKHRLISTILRQEAYGHTEDKINKIQTVKNGHRRKEEHASARNTQSLILQFLDEEGNRWTNFLNEKSAHADEDVHHSESA